MNAPSQLLPVPRPGILGIAPYVGGEAHAQGASRQIRLASNEAALGASPAAIAAYAAEASSLHRYPDGHARALRQALADVHGLPAGRIVCGAGSDELLQLLVRAYAGPGDEVLYSQHGFLIYPIAAQSVGATPVAAPETNLTADVDALLAAVTPVTRLVFVANPNNPTGTILRRAELQRLRKGLRPDILLVIDSAYAEFVDDADYTDGADLVAAGDNTVMTRTFSKIYGLAALRLGWAYCPPAIADVLNRIRGPFNVPAPAISAGVAALQDAAHLAEARAHNSRWRAWVTAELRALGLQVGESHGNFVLVSFDGIGESGPASAAAMQALLRQDGILVRQVGSYGLPHCLRITIGREEEIRAVLDAIRRGLEDLQGA